MPDDPLDRLVYLNRLGAKSVERKSLEIGSDVEIADRVGEDLRRAWGTSSMPRASSGAMGRHTGW